MTLPLTEPPAPDPRRLAAWSAHWRSGALHACAAGADAHYAGNVRVFWLDVLAVLPAGARVLELCCGNAPLARLLVDSGALARGVSIDAVDAADVAPAWCGALPAAARAAVRVQGGIDVARLPFDAAAFDLCASQYGVEYVGVAAMVEVRRVLRPGGCFAALLHAHHALPVRIAREEISQGQALLAAGGLLACAAERLDAAPDDGAADVRWRAALQRIEAAIAQAPWPALPRQAHAAVLDAIELGTRDSRLAGHAHLTRIATELTELNFRQRELLESALTVDAARTLLAALGDPQPWLDTLAFDDGGLAGWIALADRR